MTPRRQDLYDAVEGQKLGVEVADGHIIQCTATGIVKISKVDDNNIPLLAELQGCMYVPGLSHRLFSITKFATNAHKASITKNAVICEHTAHSALGGTLLQAQNQQSHYQHQGGLLHLKLQ